MPVTRSCCGRFNLRTGTIVIGCISFTSSMLFLVLSAIIINEDPPAYGDETVYIYNAKLIEVVVTVSIVCIVSFLLIIGAYKRNMWLLLPWIIVMPVCVVLSIVRFILTYTVDEFDSNSNLMPAHRSYSILRGGLNIYFLMVVISYFQTLKEERDNQKSINMFAATAPWAASTNQLITEYSEKV